MKRILSTLALLFALLAAAPAQQAVELKQENLARWNIGTGQYSGITPLADGRYAVVSDKEPADGFFIFHIAQDATTGEVTQVVLDSFQGTGAAAVDAQGHSLRDAEGVAYCPQRNTVFISGEGDQQILEYTLDGKATGQRLAVPATFSTGKIYPNYGFEALGYSPETRLFWTTTESMLRADGVPSGPLNPGANNLLRIQAFGTDLQPVAQYAYRMDRPRTEKFGSTFVFGVPAITALPDGSLLVLEREADIKKNYSGSAVYCKIFRVRPQSSWQIDSQTDLQALDPNRFMVKEPIATFSTRISPVQLNFANYEGMCLGIRLADGRQTVLLINDSQDGYSKGPFHLKDYIKVLILN